MKCGKCKFKINIGNTEETGAAFCSGVSSYFPINCKDDCHFLPRKKELYCKDCSRLGRDTACMTVRENDKVSAVWIEKMSKHSFRNSQRIAVH